MPVQADVSRHYTHGRLVEAIRAGVVSMGKAVETVTVDDLAPVDEFHIGGRRASEEFLDQLERQIASVNGRVVLRRKPQTSLEQLFLKVTETRDE